MGPFRLAKVVLLAGVTLAASGFALAGESIEPKAGKWQTWVLSSGSQFRPSPPPDGGATAQELVQVRAAIEAARRDPAALDRIGYWDAGWPSYRWQEIAITRQAKEPSPSPLPTFLWRVLTLLSVAAHDATVAAWDAKYAFNRPPPGEADPALVTVAPIPRSPSYPSEHAAVATAAAGVLAYLFPGDAASFAEQAREAGRSRVSAGVAYPSDVQAGEDLGRKVAAAVVERAKADGSDAAWTGTAPTGPGYWTGTNPRLVTLGTWKPWVLASPDQFRPAPPPAHDSPSRAAELQEVKNFQHSFQHRRAAFFWAAPEIKEWLAVTNLKIFEHRMDDNAPRAARAVALLMVASFDSFIGCFDAKYHYWTARPHMLDSSITPLFAVPNHPSYPSAHGCGDSAAEVVLSHVFPRDAALFQAMSKEGTESRLWAGIHFRSDLEAGIKLGEAVGRLVVERAKRDEAVQ